MRFTLALPVDRVDAPAEFITGDAVREIAQAAERLGYDAVYSTEHPIPEQKWLASGGHHALDPFVSLSFAAAATSRLRLLTNLIVLSYRSPYVTAKAASSLDALSDGRLTLGLGAGYLEPEFHAIGADFEARNDVSDDAIVAMKRAWTGEWLDIDAPDGTTTQHRALPRPAQQPHPPLWMGGNSKRAIRRAVDHCQGWMPFPAPPKMAGRVRTASLTSLDDLAKRLDYLHEYAAQAGRGDALDIMFMSLLGTTYGSERFEASATVDELGRMAELGVTHVLASVSALGAAGHDVATRGQYIERMDGYARDVMAKLA